MTVMNRRSNLPLRGVFSLLMAVLKVVSARSATRQQRLHAYLILSIGLAVSSGWASAWYLIAQPVTELVAAGMSVAATQSSSGAGYTEPVPNVRAAPTADNTQARTVDSTQSVTP